MRKPRVHIIYRGSGWAVKKEGTERAYKILRTQREAEKFAKKNYARGTEIIVHGKDGSIKKWL
ncbi:MAG: DUF2188 domain-containing protein [Candidatus Thorarchaeota archaeon]